MFLYWCLNWSPRGDGVPVFLYRLIAQVLPTFWMFLSPAPPSSLSLSSSACYLLLNVERKKRVISLRKATLFKFIFSSRQIVTRVNSCLDEMHCSLWQKQLGINTLKPLTSSLSCGHSYANSWTRLTGYINTLDFTQEEVWKFKSYKFQVNIRYSFKFGSSSLP